MCLEASFFFGWLSFLNCKAFCCWCCTKEPFSSVTVGSIVTIMSHSMQGMSIQHCAGETLFLSAFSIALDSTSKSLVFLLDRAGDHLKQGRLDSALLSLSDFQRWDTENAGHLDGSLMGISTPSISTILQKLTELEKLHSACHCHRKKK